jgi:hypothetical protein
LFHHATRSAASPHIRWVDTMSGDVRKWSIRKLGAAVSV